MRLKRFVFLKGACDLLGGTMAFILAYIVKFKIPHLSLFLWDIQWGEIQQHAQIEPYLASLWMIVILGGLCLMSVGAYVPTIGIMPGVDELIKVVKAMGLLVVSIVLSQFFMPLIPGSRMVVLYFLIFSVVILSAFRWIILRLERSSYAKGIGSKRALIIGSSMGSQDVAERMIMYPGMGYYYVGTIDDAPPETLHYHLKDRFKLLGSMEHTAGVCRDYFIDAIFLVKRDISNSKYRELVQFSLANNIQLNVMSEPVFDTPFIRPEAFDGMPMVTMEHYGQRRFKQWIKRWGDVVLSAFALLVLSPVFFAVMVWIKCVSPSGPVVFRQVRIGQFGREFQMLKFRSMVPNAEALTGPVMVDESGDSRYIVGGRFLRQFSLDELPQLWNVLVGQMTLVGPRPERPHFVQEFSKYVPYFNERHVVPVGVTGWAQINGRSVLTRRPEQKIKYDIYYINHWSILLDIKILIKTIGVVFSREESY